MKFLITGGAGFIGSHLADELLLRGNQIVALDDLSTGSLRNIAHHRDNKDFQFIQGSVLDERLVNEAVADADFIFHLAAAVGVNLIMEKPLESLKTNIHGTENVLNSANQFGKKVLLTSTSEIYGKCQDFPLKEDGDRVLGCPQKIRWSYSTAKAVDEVMAYLYWKEKKIPTIIVRLFNTVGPRQTGAYGMVLPRFIKQALNNEDITIYGDGTQTRCFTYVKDVVNALIELINCPMAVGNVYNIGSQEEISIKELAERVIKATGCSSKIVFIPYQNAYAEGYEDMARRLPSIEKIASAIGYAPTMKINDIINKLIESQIT
ncbi:GDP-mannose 4,6-dehydratase [Candidatus Falkowbacteria bacterium]|nr:GDP-mannose 4,6-dehydratase [Candidatus Falkowbacteria bacterium]